jgi:hypothetical protein
VFLIREELKSGSFWREEVGRGRVGENFKKGVFFEGESVLEPANILYWHSISIQLFFQKNNYLKVDGIQNTLVHNFQVENRYFK